ncbi:MAG: hypothetical protein ACLU84_07390 [Clostridia bacterium]
MKKRSTINSKIREIEKVIISAIIDFRIFDLKIKYTQIGNKSMLTKIEYGLGIIILHKYPKILRIIT